MPYNTIILTMKNFKWRSFIIKYCVIIFVPLFLIFLFFAIIITNNSNKVLYKEIESYSNQTVFRIQTALDGIIGNMNGFYLTTYSSADATVYLCTQNVANAVAIDSMTTLSERMKTYVKNSNAVTSIYFYSKSADYVLSTADKFGSGTFQYFGDKNCLTDYTENSIFVQTSGMEGKKHLTVSKIITNNGVMEGIIVFNLNYNYIYDLCSSHEADDTYIMHLIDKNGDTVLFTGVANGMTKEELGQFYNQADVTIKSNLDLKLGQSIVTAKLSSEDLCVVLKSSSGYYKKQYGSIMGNLVMMVLVLAILAIILSLLISLRFYNVISNMIAIFNGTYTKKDLKTQKSDDEINYIIQNILSTLEKNSEIESELAKRFTLLNDAKVVALQSQFNPHFLFNTLNIINSMELYAQKKDTDVTKAITLLSELLRVVLDTSTTFISLEKELHYAQNYINIMKLRYKNKFDLIFDIAEDTKQLKVLKFSLQPILENALIHGIHKLKKYGMVKISAAIEDKNLIILVEDNGEGITPEKLEEIKANILIEIIKRDRAIGLANVNQRIRLLYGEKFGLYIDSDHEGTKVKIVLPISK